MVSRPDTVHAVSERLAEPWQGVVKSVCRKVTIERFVADDRELVTCPPCLELLAGAAAAMPEAER